MSFPLDIIPMMDLVTEKRIASEKDGADDSCPAPDEERIREWQAGMRHGE
tara:strand:- start:2313 stop:2462 length:150 start_codon:yes stop_codon:yes gene_type:complete